MIEQVVIGSERGTTFPITIQDTKCNALIDTGTNQSCISEAYFKTLPQQNLKGVAVRSASGSSLAPVGFITCNITLGNKTFQHDFVFCKHLMRPLILGREFLFENELKVYYAKTGECQLDIQPLHIRHIIIKLYRVGRETGQFQVPMPKAQDNKPKKD